MKATELPEAFLKCMSPATRKDIGQKTAAEAAAVSDVKLERDLHKLIVNDLCRRRSEGQEIHWWHSRMDRKTTNALGTPDFILCRAGQLIALECKVGSNKLSIEQEAERLHVLLAGGEYHVVRDFEDYRDATI